MKYHGSQEQLKRAWPDHVRDLVRMHKARLLSIRFTEWADELNRAEEPKNSDPQSGCDRSNCSDCCQGDCSE